MNQPAENLPKEDPSFEVVEVNADIITAETAIYISEHLAFTVGINPVEDKDEQAFVYLTATKPARHGAMALPYGDVMVLRIGCEGLASASAYLAVAHDKMKTIERMIYGLAKDFKVVNFITEISFTNTEGTHCANVSNTLSVPAVRMVANWLDFSPYLQKLEESGNLVVEDPQENTGAN